MSVVLADGVGKVSAKWRPSGGEVSAGCRPTCVSIDVGRYGDQQSANISTEYQSIYIGRLSVAISAESIDRYLVDRCLKYIWSANTCSVLSLLVQPAFAGHPKYWITIFIIYWKLSGASTKSSTKALLTSSTEVPEGVVSRIQDI